MNQQINKLKKIVLLVVLVLNSCGVLKSQSYINNVLGRYLCTKKIWDNSMTIVYTNCTCHLEFVPEGFYPNCVVYRDSCLGGGVWDHVTIETDVSSDTIFSSYPSPGGAFGKLYPNDSIYYRVLYPIPPGNNYWKTFTGFKLYSTVDIEDLNLPENKILVSPQPASDILYLQSAQLSFRQEDLPSVYDISGKQIKLSIQYINANTYKLDVSNLSVGLYVISINTIDGVIRKKIVISN